VSNLEQRDPFADMDLVDIWLMIRRYRWLFLGVFLAALIVAVVAVQWVPIKYTYGISINVGAIRNSTTGKLEPVMSQDAEADALQNTIVPVVQETLAAKYPNARLKSAEVSVSVTKDGSLAALSVQGTGGQGTALRALLDGIASKMADEQDSIIKDRIASTRQLLGRQIADVSSQLAAIEKHRQQVMANGNQTDKTFTLLLLDNQIARLQQTLFDLQQNLNVDMPTDIKPTQPVGPAQRSVNPTGIGKSILVGGAFIAALLLALFAVFSANLLDTAERRRTSRS
jgi:uncharacterized protein involved in exopolysaccharide biosynthesis